MNIVTMAARNTRRNLRRSLLAAFSVCLSVLMIVLLHGFTGGFMDSLVKNYIKNETGHVHIATEGYRARERFSPVDEYIPDSDALTARISEALGQGSGGLRAQIAQRIRFGVLLSGGEKSKQALAIAGAPDTERRFLMLDTRILPGGEYCAAPGTAILGDKLAAALGIAAGGELKIVTQKADGGLGFKKLRVSGLFRTGVNSMDESVFQMGLEDARELLGMEGGAQQILVMLPGSADTAAAAARIGALPPLPGAPNLSVVPWTSIGEYPRLIALMDRLYVWIWIFVALLGAFIIANIMTMVVLERRREIGILMSMGMPKRNILALLVAEGAMLGFAGSLAGAAIGFGFNLIASRSGFDMSAALAGFTWPVDNVIYPTVSAATALAFVGLGTATAALMSWLPARKGASMQPVAAIRAA